MEENHSSGLKRGTLRGQPWRNTGLCPGGELGRHGKISETSLEVPVQSVMDLVRMEDGTLRLAGNYEEERTGNLSSGFLTAGTEARPGSWPPPFRRV